MSGQAAHVEEAEIRERIEVFERAIRAKDLEGVLSSYAPDIRSFDLVPPLQYLGAEAYRKPWEDTFASSRARSATRFANWGSPRPRSWRSATA